MTTATSNHNGLMNGSTLRIIMSDKEFEEALRKQKQKLMEKLHMITKLQSSSESTNDEEFVERLNELENSDKYCCGVPGCGEIFFEFAKFEEHKTVKHGKPVT